jgi:mono/diheme cytochrome c family protein
VSRATDTQGDQQPKLAVHNHRGYGHNGWQDHGLSVRAVAELPKVEIKASSQANELTAATVSASMAVLALSDKALEGKQLFLQQAQPGCGVCHSLADANARGVVGPNLNQLSPSLAQVESAIAQGVGAMPAYGAQLSQSEIEALAAYVVEATR